MTGSITIETRRLLFGLRGRRVVACSPPVVLDHHRRDGMRVLISACPTQVGTYRATVFDDSEPVRHVNKATAIEAAQWAVDDGFWFLGAVDGGPPCSN